MLGKKKEKKLITKLKSKYRLVIMNDDTFEEKAALRLSPMNVFVLFFVSVFIIVTSVTLLISFTSLREYIPGYTDINMREDLTILTLKADSLQEIMSKKDAFINNIKNLMIGDVNAKEVKQENESSLPQDNKIDYRISEADSLLRKEIEAEHNFEALIAGKQIISSVANFTFFTPVKGIITESFNPKENHYGVDIVGKKNEAIKATLDGTIVFATWTSETGYVIGIQHSNNLISLYKHNSVILKKNGNFVKAGEVIAIIGESGELTSGPHLHFELWFNGNPIDPENYMVF